MDQQTCLQTYSCFPFCVFKIVFGFHTLLGSLYLYYSKENFTFETDIILYTQSVKNLPALRETWVQSLGWEDPLEKEMTTYSSILT